MQLPRSPFHSVPAVEAISFSDLVVENASSALNTTTPIMMRVRCSYASHFQTRGHVSERLHTRMRLCGALRQKIKDCEFVSKIKFFKYCEVN